MKDSYASCKLHGWELFTAGFSDDGEAILLEEVEEHGEVVPGPTEGNPF